MTDRHLFPDNGLLGFAAKVSGRSHPPRQQTSRRHHL